MHSRNSDFRLALSHEGRKKDNRASAVERANIRGAGYFDVVQ